MVQIQPSPNSCHHFTNCKAHGTNPTFSKC